MRSSIKTLAVAALTAGALVAAPAAFAEDSVSQGVIGGSRTASVADTSLTAVATSHKDTTGTGTLALAVDDLSGTGAGWNVTLEASGGFVYDGTNGTNDSIPATGFVITPLTASGSAGAETLTVGDPGPLVGPVTVLTAAAGSGVGNYTQNITADLNVPADSRAGTYTGTLTTTITAGAL